MPQAKIGIIGGSGLYEIEGFHDVREVNIETPFGKPSDAITVGMLEGMNIAFLPRHGRGHRISPTDIPVRANIYALKSLGVDSIISISAVGSFKEEIHPMDLVIPDQLIDRTQNRVNTFFGKGIVVHAPFAHPFCPVLSSTLYQSALETGVRVHKGGSWVVIEGPQFSTRAESELYRSWGASIVGMTALPEARIAREAEICYAALACVTDYDCWHSAHESVTIEMIIANLLKNVGTAKEIIKKVANRISENRKCDCPSALKNAIVTSRDKIPAHLKQEMALLIGKYIPYS
ncbi:MAG: S-methyl-5'-thioadenosine phosphorylase [Dehalococcoidia bacterium]|nr:S-methyl-5'-thioadenosine phosphorylase [Dehalococcoidia bacterium]